MDDESSVRVAVRIRPQIPREVIDMCRVCTSVTPDEPQITLSSDRSFTYDYVFDMGADQVEVYETCVRQLVEGALEGYNATVLAYGQTGSGKTYTMGTGFEVEMQEGQLGILPRAIGHIFSGIRERVQNARQNGEPPPEFKIVAQFMELYNDEIIDLLDQGYMSRGLKIHEDHDGGISVKGITQQSVESAAETLNLLRQGALSRTTGATQMNAQSSRSHAIFTLLIKQQKLVKIENGDNEDSGKSEFATLSAKFHFVDLAGSERLKRTQATGERAKEGISINSGLFALGNVISALGDKSKKSSHVPYRDSKLTRLLQDSLGGNSQTVMIACISPSDSDFMETLNTLNYANRARNIKNKVTINQDKSSRTIALLREQIQELQLELLEYKQGKRLVSSDGTEVLNDMCNENILLKTEADNLRTRLKALQETVDTLSKRNTDLLAERATGSWMGAGDGPSDMKEIITEYLRQIEDLRAKLLESEALCEQFRKSVSRHQMQTSSFTLSQTNIPQQLDVHDQLPGLTARITLNNCKKDHNLSFSETSALINEAKMDLTKDLDVLSRKAKREKNGNDNRLNNEDSENSDNEDVEDEDESSSESSDTEEKSSQYDLEILQLSNEISIKQKLIEELERSQQKMLSMKQHYEDKLLQLQDRIKATQEERDKVLASMATGHQNMPSDKVKKIRDEYERKLSEMQREMKRLDSARKEHARLLHQQSQQNNQLKSLQSEVDEMKRIRVNLIKKMKEESQRHKQLELKHTREIAALRKESRRRENEIKSLQAENRVTKAVLRRRNEEVSQLRSRPHSNMSLKAAGRVAPSRSADKTVNFSPKNAKMKWTRIESGLSKVKVNKKAVVLIEKDMERLMGERETVGKELEQMIRKRDQLRLSRNANPNEIRELEDHIEAAQANINYIQENISDCQRTIIQMEDAKNDSDNFELSGMLEKINTVDECKYLIEKLFNAIIAQSVADVQTELNVETLKAKVNQLSVENETQNALLQHLIHSHHTGDSAHAIEAISGLMPRSQSNSEESSGGSSRSGSPTHSSTVHLSLPRSMNDLRTNASSESIRKSRRLTALPKDLLFPNREVEDVKGSKSNSDIPSLQRSLSHKSTELPQPIHKSKAYPETVSPRLPRRAVNYSNPKLDNMAEAADSPPGSPTTYRRFNSREENVFSRLTGGAPSESAMNIGRISDYTGKTSSRAPLICGHVASGHTRSVLSVDANDDYLFTGSQDRSVKVWDLRIAQEIYNLPGHYNNVDVVKYCESSRLLFSVSSAYVKVWDMRMSPLQCIKTLCSSGLSVAGSAQSTNPSRTLTVPPGETQVNDIALNDSGRTLYTAAGDRARVWDLRMFSCIGKLAGGHQAAVKCLAVAKISAMEDLVVTGSKDHYIKVFEISANDPSGAFTPKWTLDPPHYDGIQALALQNDVLFSGSRDMCIKKWDLSRGELIQSVNNAHGDWICGLQFLPGGDKLVSGCRSGYLKVWSTDSCSLLGEVKAHNASINSIAVNSTHLFTASRDCMLQHGRGEIVETPSKGIHYDYVNGQNIPYALVGFFFDSSVRFWKANHVAQNSRNPPSSPQKEQRTSPSHHYNSNSSPIHSASMTKSSNANVRSTWVS